jgi:hypothetical protein
MRRFLPVAVWTVVLAAGPALAGDPVPGAWHARGDRTGKAVSTIEVVEPADGTLHEAELWVDDGTPEVRGHQSILDKTKAWLRGR